MDAVLTYLVLLIGALILLGLVAFVRLCAREKRQRAETRETAEAIIRRVRAERARHDRPATAGHGQRRRWPAHDPDLPYPGDDEPTETIFR